MSKKQQWPRWIDVRYFKETEESIMGYTGCANDKRMLFDIFDHLNLLKSNIILIRSNDKLLNESEITDLLKWIEKKRREKAEHEEREKAKIKAKESNASSKFKSG